MERNQIKSVLETMFFITDRPIPLQKLVQLMELQEAELRESIQELRSEMESRGSALQILEIGGGFQFGTRSEYASWIRKLYGERLTVKLSQPTLETLSIIAYKQPITRAEIEEIRGVEVIASLETLLERRLIRVTGRKETVGRPLLYGTTMEFLRHFGFNSVEELPNIDSFISENTAGVAAASLTPQGPRSSAEGAAAEAAPTEQTAMEDN
ncbi:MAG: SMC-Scp complex subunit ScpB [Elusimicrobia bacterium]|nr:SMC-Scp complex subunit ScpB [Elusimicrobiota bacterium]